MPHDPKVGETWRYQSAHDRWVDFVVTHFDGMTPHGRVVATDGSAHGHTVGQEQSLSIKGESVEDRWRLAPRASQNHAPSPISHEIIRAVRIWPPEYDGPDEWRCDVRLDWCTDETNSERVEHGTGATPEEAYERACLIAAAFMAVPIPVARDRWPANGIDTRELV